jgi:hypothetical protein
MEDPGAEFTSQSTDVTSPLVDDLYAQCPAFPVKAEDVEVVLEPTMFFEQLKVCNGPICISQISSRFSLGRFIEFR